MKRFISLFLTICLITSICAFMPLTASAATSGTYGDNITWKIKDEVLTFTGSGSMEKVSGCPDFRDREEFNNFTKAVFDDRITEIPEKIFYQCSKLKEVSLPENLTYIPYYAFAETGLTNIVIPDKVAIIESEAFKDVLLDTVTIPQSTLLIGACAFDTIINGSWGTDEDPYYGIKDVYYKGTQEQWNNIKIIPEPDDYHDYSTGNQSLLNATKHFNNNISYSGKCGENATWKIFDNVLHISGTGKIDSYCDAENGQTYPIWLTYDYDTIKIDEGITGIGMSAFDECITSFSGRDNTAFGSLSDEAELANGLKTFSDSWKLYFCIEKVKQVYLPKSLTTIGYGAFFKCNKLKDVYYAGTETEWKNVENYGSNDSLDSATMHYNAVNQNANFENITFNDIFFEYDGTEKEILIGGNLPTGANVSYLNNKGTEAGIYAATAVITCTGYNTLTLNANMTIGFCVNNVKLPLKGYETGKAWDNCWTFAQNIYKEIWGTSNGDDLLRLLDEENKTITEKNTRNFILSAELGANIRLDDGEDTNMHSLILVQKDNNGFTVYHGNYNGKIYFTYYTYSGFAEDYADYRYFEYIEFPNAVAYTKAPQNITLANFGEKIYGEDAFDINVTPDATSNLDNFTYASDNKNVAMISENGTITIVGAGEANISVTEAGNDDYAKTTVTKKLTVKPKEITITSIDVENKTAVLTGILTADESDVTLDFDKITLTIEDAVDETTSNAVLTNFVLKGDKAANYNVTTETLNTTVANENVVTVTITAENGTAIGAAKYLKGAEITVNATPNSGYKFDGWYNGDTSVSTSASYTFKAESDISLVAKFSRKSTGGGGGSSTSTYTVKFETNGGSKVESVKVDKNKTVTEPTAPTKDGFEFAGWYTDKALTTKYDFDTKVTKGITLYAAWTEKKTEVKDDDTEPTEPTTPENKITFTDVKENDWFAENVKYVLKNGLMNGTTETEFAPNDNLTRAMLVAILYRAAGEPETDKSIPFADVTADSYYANAVIWAQQNGIVSGVNENEFAPDENITREQIATIIYRYANYKGYDTSVKADISSFTDADEISEYAVEAMQYAVGSGLIKGKTETTLNPKDNATRAEIAAFLQRFIEGNK